MGRHCGRLFDGSDNVIIGHACGGPAMRGVVLVNNDTVTPSCTKLQDCADVMLAPGCARNNNRMGFGVHGQVLVGVVRMEALL